MSLRANSLTDHIRDLRDLAVRPDRTELDDQARPGSVGRAVLQALAEIDRIAQTPTEAAGALGGGAAGMTSLRSTLSLAGQSLAFPGTAYSRRR